MLHSIISKRDLSLISGGKDPAPAPNPSNGLNIQNITITPQIAGNEHGAGAHIVLSYPANDNVSIIGKTTIITDYNTIINTNNYVGIHGHINFFY